VIPNGVDLDVYRPGSRDEARRELGLPEDAFLVVFVGNRFLARGTWKDFPTVREAVVRAARDLDAPLELHAVGDEGAAAQEGRARIVLAGHWREPERVARYLRAADLALHAARPEAENFPNVVLEALACGTPVVATAVGGIPEQVAGLWDGPEPALRALNPAAPAEATGTLVPAADAAAMAAAVVRLLRDPPLRAALGRNGAARAQADFGLDRQVAAYRDWYEEMLAE